MVLFAEWGDSHQKVYISSSFHDGLEVCLPLEVEDEESSEVKVHAIKGI
jgi:hypothetical protein